MRWHIEQKYDDLKNKLEIENFSGNSNIAVLQDFYATMFLNNIASMMALACEYEIKEHCKAKQLKYEYKANISLTISIMKICDCKIKCASYFYNLHTLFYNLSLSDKVLIRKRAVIESVNDFLKNICQIEHSRHRSVDNFLVNVLSALTHSFLPKKPSLHLNNSLSLPFSC